MEPQTQAEGQSGAAARTAAPLAINPLVGFGPALLMVAAGLAISGVRLGPSSGGVIGWWVSTMLVLHGLMSLRRWAWHSTAARVRRVATVMLVLDAIGSLGSLMRWVPGVEALGWLGLASTAALLIAAWLHHELGSYCKRWMLDDQLVAWRSTKWVWLATVSLLVGVLLAMAWQSGRTRITVDDGLALIVGCLWLTPHVFFLWAASSTWSAAKRMRGGCAKCGFDIRNLPTNVCPECGRTFPPERAALPPPHGVPQGAWSGAVRVAVLGLALGIPAAATYWQMPGVRPVTGQPVWMLLRDAQRIFQTPPLRPDDPWARNGWRTITSGYEPSAVDAQRELLARVQSGQVSRHEATQLATIALKVQADQQRPMGEWGDIMDALAAARLLSESEVAAFARGLLVWKLVTRERVRPGDRLPFEIQAWHRGPSKTGASFPDQASLQLTMVLQSVRIAVGDGSMSDIHIDQNYLNWSSREGVLAYSSNRQVNDPEFWGMLPLIEGPAGIRCVSAEIVIVLGARQLPNAPATPREIAAHIASAPGRLETNVEVTAGIEPTWEVVLPDEGKDLIGKTALRVDGHDGMLALSRSGLFSKWPAWIVADAFLEEPSGEVPLGTVMVDLNMIGTSEHFMNPDAFASLKDESLVIGTVRLRSAPEKAVRYVGPEQVLDVGELSVPATLRFFSKGRSKPARPRPEQGTTELQDP